MVNELKSRKDSKMHRSRIIIVTCLMAVPACAQQQQPSQEYTIKLTAQDLDVIGAALGEQPFNKAAPLINKLRQQVMEQQQAKEAPKVEEKK